jgi:hypothetical protein
MLREREPRGRHVADGEMSFGLLDELLRCLRDEVLLEILGSPRLLRDPLYAHLVAVDQRRFWRSVSNQYRAWEQDAPDGNESRVRVFVAGRAEPIEVGQVVTDKDPDYAWVAFAASSTLRLADPDGDPRKSYADDELVWAHEGAILRVELTYVRKEPDARRQIGFTVSEEPAST